MRAKENVTHMIPDYEKYNIEVSQVASKYKSYFNLLNQWINVINHGKSIDDYFIRNNYKTVAIYGMGEIGERLRDALVNSDYITGIIGIDRDSVNKGGETEIYSLDEDIPKMDVIVVTPFIQFAEIKNELNKKMIENVISVEDVIYSLY